MTALATLPNPRLSKAILIGTSECRAADDLPDLPAVRHNITDLRASLTDSRHGILIQDNCVTVTDPPTPQDFMRRLRTVARQADDFLLVYYAGHGVRHATKDDLYLTLRDTDTEVLNSTAVPLDWVKEEISQSPARTRLLILDCCYSGLAIPTLSPVIEQRELVISGSAVIASSPKNAKSHSPSGRRHTAFSGELGTLLKDGSPNEGEPLTVMTLYSRIDAALARGDFPKPKIATTGMTSQLLLRKETPPPVHDVPAPAPKPTLDSPPAAKSTPRPNLQQPAPLARDAKFWMRIVCLRFLWIELAAASVWFLSGLFGVFFADPPSSFDGGAAYVGASGAVVFGALLYLLNRRWRHLRGQTNFTRSTIGRVILVVTAGLSLYALATGVSAT